MIVTKILRVVIPPLSFDCTSLDSSESADASIIPAVSSSEVLDRCGIDPSVRRSSERPTDSEISLLDVKAFNDGLTTKVFFEAAAR